MKPVGKKLKSKHKVHKRKCVLNKFIIRSNRNNDNKRYVRFRFTPTTHFVSISDLNSEQEVPPIYSIHQSRRAPGKGSWKIIPKDSCEVCRERRKRELKRHKNRYDRKNGEEGEKKGKRGRGRGQKQGHKPKSRNRKQSSRSSTSCTSASTSCTCMSVMDT